MILLAIFASLLMSAIIWRLFVLARVYRETPASDYYKRNHFAGCIANCVFAAIFDAILLIYCFTNHAP